jgi:SHS2 domain-containing protein
MAKRIDYFDHDADIGIIGRGQSIESAFVAAAEAVFSIMTNISIIKPTKSITIEFTESDPELALVIWLNLLLAKARESNVIFSKFALQNINDHWLGSASGETWQEQTLRGTEVKGATLTMLSVKKQRGEWKACCVVDV